MHVENQQARAETKQKRSMKNPSIEREESQDSAENRASYRAQPRKNFNPSYYGTTTMILPSLLRLKHSNTSAALCISTIQETQILKIKIKIKISDQRALTKGISKIFHSLKGTVCPGTFAGIR